MRTHGTRMNRERTREVLDKLVIPVVKSNGHGIEIHRTVDPGVGALRTERWRVCALRTERWRVCTGGGIAGNADQVWISPIVRVDGHAPRGPYWNKAQLEKALRAWREGRMSDQHSTWVTRHDYVNCHTSLTWPAAKGDCGTRFEARCSCGFSQGAICHEHADAIGRGHRAKPTVPVISWDPGPPLTATTITDQDLRDLFARHCECRPLDLERGEGDHAAIHDCDTGILSDVQYALGIVLFNDIGRVQAIREARSRCAEVINAARKGA